MESFHELGFGWITCHPESYGSEEEVRELRKRINELRTQLEEAKSGEKAREFGVRGIVLEVGELVTVVLQENGVRVWR